MFDTLLGLPAHPLYVHFAVGLVPLSALLTAWAAWASPVRRRAVATPLVLLNAVTVVVAFVAKESGESLEHRLPREALIEAHAHLGDVLPLFPASMLVVSAALWWLTRRIPVRDPEHLGATAVTGRRPGAATAVAVVATILALATCWWTFRVGHSGAESVWHDVPLTRSEAPVGE